MPSPRRCADETEPYDTCHPFRRWWRVHRGMPKDRLLVEACPRGDGCLSSPRGHASTGRRVPIVFLWTCLHLETDAYRLAVDMPPRGDGCLSSPRGHASTGRRVPIVSRWTCLHGETVAYRLPRGEVVPWGRSQGVLGVPGGVAGEASGFFGREARRLFSRSTTISTYGPSRKVTSASLPSISGSA